MSYIPDELKYSEDHEWARIQEDSFIVCGITDHAQEQLSDIVFVELPEIDYEATDREQISVVESVKAVADIFSPVSGKVVEVNNALEDSPELINSAPYEDGWIFRMEVNDITELDNLMDSAAYKKHIESEE